VTEEEVRRSADARRTTNGAVVRLALLGVDSADTPAMIHRNLGAAQQRRVEASPIIQVDISGIAVAAADLFDSQFVPAR
jgi:hypothetical protein